jgi:tripeptide aminopeptidase
MEGNCEKSVMKYLIRNHDRETFERQKQDFSVARDFLNNKYGYEICRLEIKDSYYNMREKIEPVMHIVDWAVEAIREVGLTPRIEPIRGGTDGARLTFLGLPCPNLGTGGYNFHGPYEYVSVQEMDQSVEILRRIIAQSREDKKMTHRASSKK